LFKVTKTSEYGPVLIRKMGFNELLIAQHGLAGVLIIYLMRSTISAKTATATQSTILAKKTPPTPM
jgi:hypothetical protein